MSLIELSWTAKNVQLVDTDNFCYQTGPFLEVQKKKNSSACQALTAADGLFQFDRLLQTESGPTKLGPTSEGERAPHPLQTTVKDLEMKVSILRVGV